MRYAPKQSGSLIECKIDSSYPVCSIYKYDGSQAGDNIIIGRVYSGDNLLVLKDGLCYEVYSHKLEKTGYVASSLIEDYFFCIEGNND